MAAVRIGRTLKTIMFCECVVRLYATVAEIGGENPPRHKNNDGFYERRNVNKKIIAIIMASALGVVSVVTTLAPKEIYVSSTIGNDTNSGTQTAPYKTISKALSVSTTGDILYVEGSYGTINITKSVKLIGINYPKVTGGIRCYKIDNVTISGFEVTGSKTTAGILIDQCNNTIVEGNIVHDNIGASISGIVLRCNFCKATNNDVFNNQYVGIRIGGTSTTVEVSNNRVHDHTLSTVDSDCIDIVSSSVTKVNIYGNIVYSCSDDGIDTWTSGNNIIENNTVYNNGGTGDGNGIKLGGSTTGGNNIVKGNISYNNEASGFTSNGNGNYYENNVSYGNGEWGFIDSWRTSGNTTLSSFINNVAYDNSDGNFGILKKYISEYSGNSESIPIIYTVTSTATFTPIATITSTLTKIVDSTNTPIKTVYPSETSTPSPTVAPTATVTPLFYPYLCETSDRFIICEKE